VACHRANPGQAERAQHRRYDQACH
jgi:hypothetical protein